MPWKLQDFPPYAKIITSTWAMKKKANGTYRARINIIGYEKVEGIHYYTVSIALSITNYTSIRISMVLTLMDGWITKILDMRGVFLHNEFYEGEKKIYMSMMELFEGIYRSDMVFMLLKTIYWSKNTSKDFLRELLRSFSAMGCRRSNVDP